MLNISKMESSTKIESASEIRIQESKTIYLSINIELIDNSIKAIIYN